MKSHTRKSNTPIYQEPDVTPSILARIPDVLRSLLIEQIKDRRYERVSLLISSNSLANKFILTKWGIRPSQRRRYKNLFVLIRRQCRLIFQNLLKNGRIDWANGDEQYTFGVYKYDDIRGNLILGFVHVPPNSEWTLPIR